MNETQDHYVILAKKQENNNHQSHNFQHHQQQSHHHHHHHHQQQQQQHHHHHHHHHDGEENNYNDSLPHGLAPNQRESKQHQQVSPSANLSSLHLNSMDEVRVKLENNLNNVNTVNTSKQQPPMMAVGGPLEVGEPGAQVSLAPLQTAQENTVGCSNQELTGGERLTASAAGQPIETSQQDRSSRLMVVANGDSGSNKNYNININGSNSLSNSGGGQLVVTAHGSAPTTNDSTERRYRPQKYCAVCGDKAIACNFNAVTCESCKAFFRRNAFKEQWLKCLFDNRCIIDRVTRRFCSKCRLLKCLQIGMKREWILTDEQKHIKRVKIMQNKQSRQQAPTTSSSDQSDNSPPKLNGSDQSLSSGGSCSASSVNRLPTATSGRGPFGQQPVNKDPLDTHLQSSSPPTSGGSDSRARSSQIKVETKDATTSCPDEFDLGAASPGNSHLVHYCSLASQCQYCSLRLTGCAPNAGPMNHNDFQRQQQQHQHHQQQQTPHQMLHQHQINALNPPNTAGDPYERQSGSGGGGGHLAAGSIYSAVDTNNQMQRPSGQQLIQPSNLTAPAADASLPPSASSASTSTSCCCLDQTQAGYTNHQQHHHQSQSVGPAVLSLLANSGAETIEAWHH